MNDIEFLKSLAFSNFNCIGWGEKKGANIIHIDGGCSIAISDSLMHNSIKVPTIASIAMPAQLNIEQGKNINTVYPIRQRLNDFHINLKLNSHVPFLFDYGKYNNEVHEDLICFQKCGSGGSCYMSQEKRLIARKRRKKRK